MARAETYEIVTETAGGWDAGAVGEGNEFGTTEAAEAALDILLAMEEFRGHAYALRVVGERFPMVGTIRRPAASEED